MENMGNVVTITRNPVLDIAGLPPRTALDALREQLSADLESGQDHRALISGQNISMIAGVADHGIETAMDLLVLCLASHKRGVGRQQLRRANDAVR